MKELDNFTVEKLGEIKNAFLDCHKETAPSIGEVFALIDIALAAKRAEPVSLESAIEKFKEYNIGFPVEKLKADFVISWCLTNLTPQLNSPEIPEGWIKCSDQMPEVDDWVVGWHIEGYHRIVSWQKSYGNYLARSASHCWQGDNDDVELEGSITHWMPLPASPEKPL